MTDAEKEAIERAFQEWVRVGKRIPRGESITHGAFTAGYLACQQAVAGERDHLEEAARILRTKPESLADFERRREAWDAWYERDERLRRSKQEGSG